MKKTVHSNEEVVSNNNIFYADIQDNPNSQYIHFANVVSGLYTSFVHYADIKETPTFIDFVELQKPTNKAFIEFVKIISDIDFHIRKLSDKLTFEDIKSFIVAKTLSDYVFFPEEVSFDTEKTKQEIITISELVSIQITKPLSDNFVLPDSVTLTIDFQRNFSESVSIYDSVSFDLIKYFEDFLYIEDVYSFNLNKPRVDSFGVSDDNTKAFNKSNVDTFNFPENLYFNFQKVLTETSEIQEVFSFQFQKSPFIDHYDVSDLFGGVLNKIKFDEIVYSDSNYKSFTKGLTESVIVYEQFSYQLEKHPFFDSFSVIDSYNNHLRKNRSDNFSLSDYSELFLNKTILDLINIEEIKFFEIYKPKSDYFHFIDRFNFNFDKSLSETFNLLESQTTIIEKIKSDIIEISDVGSVLLSNYSTEGNYFSEDYVGTTTNF